MSAEAETARRESMGKRAFENAADWLESVSEREVDSKQVIALAAITGTTLASLGVCAAVDDFWASHPVLVKSTIEYYKTVCGELLALGNKAPEMFDEFKSIVSGLGELKPVVLKNIRPVLDLILGDPQLPELIDAVETARVANEALIQTEIASHPELAALTEFKSAYPELQMSNTEVAMAILASIGMYKVGESVANAANDFFTTPGKSIKVSTKVGPWAANVMRKIASRF